MKLLQLSLEDTWDECLKMWRWIVRHLDEDSITNFLKLQYLEQVWQIEHNDISEPIGGCFFCNRHVQQCEKHKRRTVDVNFCWNCPGVIEDANFDCESEKYHYINKPKLFLKKLESLNQKRKLKIKRGQS